MNGPQVKGRSLYFPIMKGSYLLVAVLIAVAFALVGCGGSGGGSSSNAGTANLATCTTNMKSITLGFLMYANDYDDVLPVSNTWCDATLPYVKQKGLYHCPALTTATQVGYSLNSAYAGAGTQSITNPNTATLVFESNSLTWNSTQLLSDFS